MIFLLVTLITATLFHPITAIPSPALELRQSITTLSASQISSFKPFTFFASAAYCPSSTTINWRCGANCDANAGFEPTASGGDGTDVPFWYVGFDPSLNTVIVAHQGSDANSILSTLQDADVILQPLDSALFPGLPSSIEVHSGFAGEQARTASEILSAVQSTLSAHASTKPSVTTVGHSNGAAVSLLDAVYLPLHLPVGIQVKYVGYGLPRVGNQAFADYVDQHITALDGGRGLTRINNKEDPVPILPGRFLGFHHPSGEIHIQDSNAWDACPGQDNTSKLCTVGDVSNIFEGDISDHSGPYDGVEIGC